MQRLSAWARWIGAGLFIVVVFPLVVEFLKHQAERYRLYDRPQETFGAALS